MKRISSKILYGLLSTSILTTTSISSVVLLSNKSNESKDNESILTRNFNLNKNETLSNENISNDFRNYESNSKFNLHEFNKNSSSLYKPFKESNLNITKTNYSDDSIDLGVVYEMWTTGHNIYLTNKIKLPIRKINFSKNNNYFNNNLNFISNNIVDSIWPKNLKDPGIDSYFGQYQDYINWGEYKGEKRLMESILFPNTFSSFGNDYSHSSATFVSYYDYYGGSTDFWTNDMNILFKSKILKNISMNSYNYFSNNVLNIYKNQISMNENFINGIKLDHNEIYNKNSAFRNRKLKWLDISYDNEIGWNYGNEYNVNLNTFKYPIKQKSFKGEVYPNYNISSKLKGYTNINIDLSKLITINNQETSSYYDVNNNFHKQAPKIKLGWNLELLTALKEASLIKERVVNVFNSLNNIVSFDGNIVNQLKLIFNDIIQYKTDLNIIDDYLNQLKESKGLNIAYINKNNQKVKYAQILEKYDWSMLDYQTNDPLKELGFDNIINQILKWDIPYKFALPQVFKNNIYADIKTTGSNEIKRNVKLYDAYSKNWLEYNVPNYGQQQINYDNNVDVELKNIRMMTPNTIEEVASYSNKENNTLNANNIVSLTKELNSKKTNIDLVDNSIKFSFGYNPSIDNTILDTNNKTRSIATFDNYVSDIYNFDKIDYVDTTLKGLKIPEDIIQKEKDIIWLNESFVYPNLSKEEELIYPEIKKYIILSKKHRAAANDYANNRISEQEYFNAKKELDQLGYFYTNLKIKIPVNYYLAPNEYQRLINNHSIIPKGYDEISKTYEYWVKYDAKKIPLEINNLDKYIEFKSKKSDIVENKNINELNLELNKIRSELDLLKKDLNATQNNAKQMYKKIEEFINYVNDSYKTIIDQNPYLKQKYETQIKLFNDNLSNIKNEINNRYNEFKKDNSYTNNRLKQELNKTFKYNFSLEKMLNLVRENINNLNKMFELIPEANNLKNELILKAKEIKNQYDLEKNKIEYYEIELNKYLIQNQKLLNNLNQIKELNYYDELTISFNIQKMIKDSGNQQVESYWWTLTENEWNSYFFVSKEIFANRLNEIIKLKHNLDFNITKEALMHDQHNPNQIIKINNNEYSYNFELDPEKNVWLRKWELILKRNELINLNLRNSELYSKEAIRKIQNLKTNFEINHNNINKILNEISNFKNEFLNNKLVDNLESLIIPNTIENLKLYKSVNDAIKNYKDINIYNEKWNSLYMGIIIFGSMILLISIIGLSIYISSKKRRKTIKVDDDELEAFLKFKSNDDLENEQIKERYKK